MVHQCRLLTGRQLAVSDREKKICFVNTSTFLPWFAACFPLEKCGLRSPVPCDARIVPEPLGNFAGVYQSWGRLSLTTGTCIQGWISVLRCPCRSQMRPRSSLCPISLPGWWDVSSLGKIRLWAIWAGGELGVPWKRVSRVNLELPGGFQEKRWPSWGQGAPIGEDRLHHACGPRGRAWERAMRLQKCPGLAETSSWSSQSISCTSHVAKLWAGIKKVWML